jgi:hypothetical protein
MGNQGIERLFRLMNRRRLPDFIAGLDTLPFDRHGLIARQMLGYLVSRALRRP